MSVAASAIVDHPVPAIPTQRRIRLLPVPGHDPAPTPGPVRAPRTASPQAGHQLRLVVSDPIPAPRVWSDSVRTDVGTLGDAGEFARRITQAVVDVLAGHRPAHQLLRWSRPDVFEALRRRAAVTVARPNRPGVTPAGRRPVVRSVRVCDVAAHAVEASAVVIDGDRARAIAMRLEAIDGRWRLTALELG